MNLECPVSPLGTILIAENSSANLDLLTQILANAKYQIWQADNGETALKLALEKSPDLILLAIDIPEINGYQVCQRLKENPQARDIPVIFQGVADNLTQRIKAFQVGGVDYIVQPFHSEEILARIGNQFTLRLQQKRLSQEIQQRKQAENSLINYLHAVAHDLRNPTVAMDIVLHNLLKQRPSDDAKVTIPVKVLETMAHSCDRQIKLINSLVETQKLEIWGVPLEFQPTQLYDLIQELLIQWQPLVQESKAQIVNLISPDLPLVNVDRHRLLRVYENLIMNALKHNPPGIELIFAAEVDIRQNILRCIVADNGVGIEATHRENLFKLYHKGKTGNSLSLGLGLYLCRQIIEAHGGVMGIETNLSVGSQFWFTLPLTPI